MLNIRESGENYLEAILALGEKGPVRSIDVANFLEFSKPSVSRHEPAAGERLRGHGQGRLPDLDALGQ